MNLRCLRMHVPSLSFSPYFLILPINATYFSIDFKIREEQEIIHER